MDDRTGRLFSALGVLVVVWIVVYWSWPVRDPAVTASPTETDPPTALGSEIEPNLVEPRPGRAEGA
ncbi:MAG: hypothetical protein K8E66_07330, partial [Phycisphaerales bacterium]|nr:hypothetical protein [Phycisphaerales bacterium]